MQSLLDTGDDVGWRLFWEERAALFPSTAWATDALDRPSLGEVLQGGASPIFVFPYSSVDTPPEYLSILSDGPGSARARLVSWEGDEPPGVTGHALLPLRGMHAGEAEHCLRGLVTEPLDPAQYDFYNDEYPSPCAW